MRRSIYTAGPMAGCSYAEVVGWRKEAAKYLADNDIDTLIPEIYSINPGEIYTPHAVGGHFATQRGIVTNDRRSIFVCDAVIMNLSHAKKVSIGSCVEFGWADAYRKPVIVIMPNPDFNPHDHAFIWELSSYVVYTLDDALDVVIQLLTGKPPNW